MGLSSAEKKEEDRSEGENHNCTQLSPIDTLCPALTSCEYATLYNLVFHDTAYLRG